MSEGDKMALGEGLANQGNEGAESAEQRLPEVLAQDGGAVLQTAGVEVVDVTQLSGRSHAWYRLATEGPFPSSWAESTHARRR